RPHSSWNLSSSSRPSSSGDMSLKTDPPRVRHPVDGHRDHLLAVLLDHEGLAANPADPSPRQSELTHEPLEVPLRFARHRNHHPPHPNPPPATPPRRRGRAPRADPPPAGSPARRSTVGR